MVALKIDRGIIENPGWLWLERDVQHTRCNDKIVVLMKTTLQLYFKTFIEKINLGNLIM